MIRPSWKSLLVGAIIAGALTANPTRADAHLLWWRHYGVASWWCGPCVGVACDPCVVWYRPGRPLARVLHWPWHWCHRCCTWCEWCVCDPCCCEEASVVPEGAAPSQSEPQLAPPKKEAGGGDLRPVPAGPEGKSAVPDPGKSSTEARSDRGLLTIRVPAGAKVFINGYETRSQGTHRQYVSTGLAAGNLYPYAITVMVPRAPQTTSQTVAGPQWDTRVETVYLKAGEHLSVDFERAAERVLVARAE